MSNTFITPAMVARDASIVLNNLLTLGNVLHRDKEAQFTGSKIGDSLKVTVPPVLGDANEFSGSTSATPITETQIDLTLEKHFYHRVDLTSKQKSLELHDFTRLVTVPIMRSISQSIQKLFLRHLQVFRANLAGTVGNRPSTMAHIAAANKVLNDNFIPESGRVMLVDTTVEQSLIQLSQFTSVDYGADAGAGLRNATLGDRYGFRFLRDANLGAFSRSAAANDIAGTVLTNGTPAVGATTLNIDGITSTTGTIYAGTVFTLAGDTTRYVVRKDAPVAGNAADVVVYPPLAAAPGDGAVVTFEAAGYMNVAFHPAAVTAAIVAPEPLNGNSSRQSINGIGVRVSMDSSLVTLSDSIVIDVFAGARVIQPNGGCLVAGG